MSVQAGIWNFDGRVADRELVRTFSESLRYTGPEGAKSYIDGPIAILYLAFHTTAESRLERQPYVSSGGQFITWDGRLDNRQELAAAVNLHYEPQLTDVEIVAAAFDRCGTGCFPRIIGDWALSVWRPQESQLILAVDYLSIRHLFYSVEKETVSWASDPSPLMLLYKRHYHIDDNYIAGYFALDPESDITPFQEIRQVAAGHYVTINKSAVSSRRYWIPAPYSIRYRADGEYEEHFRNLFRQAVSRRLRAGTPVLAELSGGIDSSSIVCMADNILSDQGGPAPRLDTISHYDLTEPNTDDWKFLRIIEQERGREGTHLDVAAVTRAPNCLEYPQLNALPGYLGAWHELDIARGEVVRRGGYRVVLSGVGGDEFLGGITDPSAQLADALLQCRFAKLAKELVAWALIKKKPATYLLWQSIVSMLPSALARYLVDSAGVEPWVQPEFAKRTRIGARLLDVQEHFGLHLPTRRSFAGGLVMMANKMAKRLGPTVAPEEARYPFLDRDLIEFLISIPAEQIVRPGERRSLMRRSLRTIVPEAVLFRRTKQFAARTPLLTLDNNLDQLENAFRYSIAARLGYLQPRILMDHVHSARNGRMVHIVRLLRAISLEFWLRDLVSRDLIRPDGHEQALPYKVHHASWAVRNNFPVSQLARWPEHSGKGGQNHV